MRGSFCSAASRADSVLSPRVNDWLHGVPTHLTRDLIAKKGPRSTAVADLKSGDRLRLVHQLVTGNEDAGGLGLKVGVNGIEAIMGLHDQAFNKAWMNAIQKEWILSDENLLALRDYLGERVAFYFAFTSYYTAFLVAPSILALLIHFFVGAYSVVFAVFIVLWSLVFVHAWTRRSRDLALHWRTKNISRSDFPRPGYVPDPPVLNPLTGRPLMPDAPLRRWIMKMTVSMPFVIGSALLLFFLNFVVFSIETWAYEYYSGPHATLVKAVPILAYSLGVGPIASQLSKLARYLTTRENYPTVNQHADSVTAKIFLFQAVTGFSYLVFLIYLYYPLAGRFSWLSNHADPERLKSYVTFYLITAQAIQFVTEYIQPVVINRAMEFLKGGAKRAELEFISDPIVRQIVDELDRPEWDTYSEYAQLVSQLGYLALFSLCLPFGVLASFFSNVIELRGDMLKIMLQLRRPIPARVESSGQWNSAMLVISFFAAITNASILGMFGIFSSSKLGEASVPPQIDLWAAVPVTLVAVLLWIGANSVIGGAISSIPLSRQKEVDKLDVETRALLLRMLDLPEGLGRDGFHVDPAREEEAVSWIYSLYKLD